MDAELPSASLSMDLDNKWSYLKTHGDLGWESFPSYLDVLMPRVLSLLSGHKLTITFFIVGQDAALEKNHDILGTIAAAGHEVGNHSFRHEPWMNRYSKDQVATEIAVAEEHIERVTGQKPVGFRGPGYSVSAAILRELVRRGYLYDASTLPSLVAPLARAYYFATAEFTADQKRERHGLGGSFRDGFRPIKPYRWQTDEGEIIEMPVTTMPGLRVPIHVSYLMGLEAVSPVLALSYFNAALALCRWSGVQPSLLLHPTDFLGFDDIRDLSFLPGMRLRSERKMALVADVLTRLSATFNVLTLRQHVHEVSQKSPLRSVKPALERNDGRGLA